MAMDDDHFLSVPIFVGLIIVSIHLILKVGKRSSKNNLPPGPWKLPIIGSLHHLIGGLPHHRMRELSQKYGPIMHLQLGETPAIVVSSAEIAKDVLKTHEANFPQRPHLDAADITTYDSTNIAFSPYGDYWKQIRKIATLELLSAKRVRSFQSIREEEVSTLVRYVSTNVGSPVNLSQKLMSMTYDITARASLGGEKSKDQDAFVSSLRETMKLTASLGVANLFPSQKWLTSGVMHKLKELHRDSDMALDNIITAVAAATKKIDGDGSLLSVLLNLKDHGDLEFRLTLNNIKAVLVDMFIGGSETTSTAMEWVFSEMLKNPKVLERAQAEVREVFGSQGYVDETALQELKFLKAVIKETLRLHPPGPLLPVPRECTETCEINGYTIPAGTQAFVNVWAIGRDPNYWSQADEFYPERFLDCPIDYKGSHFEFLPFGAGKRMCPAISFAVANIELPLAQLLYYFNWELPSTVSHEDFDMSEAFGTTVRRKNDLLAIPISYNPAGRTF